MKAAYRLGLGGIFSIGIVSLATVALANGPRNLSDYAIFAGNQVTLSTLINSSDKPLGLVGSNGDILFGSGATSGVIGTQFEGGGSIVGPGPASATSLLFNGNVQTVRGSNITGTIDAGGAVVLGGIVNGNVTASGNITISGYATASVASNASVALVTSTRSIGGFGPGRVGGSVTAAQDLTLQDATSIGGAATYGGALSFETLTTIGGPVTKVSSTTVPNTYSAVYVPITSFTAGGPDVAPTSAATLVLAPGSYGNLSSAGAAATVELSPGKYFFNSVTATNFLTLNYRLDLPGNIEIYVVGNYTVPSHNTELNGSPSRASRVLIESLGTIHVGLSDLGTLYAPSGDVQLDPNTVMLGSVIAGHNAILGSGSDVQFVPSSIAFAPEPASVAVMSLGAIALLFKRQRQLAVV